MSKYKSKKVTVDGIEFQSKAEAKYYEQLKWMKANKQIKDFELQPRYLLQESFKKNGKTFRKIEYIADFKVIKPDGSVEVIDIKGFVNPTFSIKRKLFERKYLDKLVLLKYVNKKIGFMDLDEYSKRRKKAKKREGA